MCLKYREKWRKIQNGEKEPSEWAAIVTNGTPPLVARDMYMDFKMTPAEVVSQGGLV